MIDERRLSLDEEVLAVELVALFGQGSWELRVNDCYYGSSALRASDDAVKKFQEVHAVALEAMRGRWTVREMNKVIISFTKPFRGHFRLIGHGRHTESLQAGEVLQR